MNPLTAAIFMMVLTIFPGRMAHREILRRSRSRWAGLYYVASMAASFAISLWALDLGGWWYLVWVLECISIGICSSMMFLLITRQIPPWEKP